MAKVPPTDWAKTTEAMYPHLSEAERENLRKIWAANSARFEPLKEQIVRETDPDFTFDPHAGAR